MIARTRKRPRTKSASFKTFWWLLTHEAVLNICRTTMPRLSEEHLRAWLDPRSTSSVLRLGDRMLRQDRGRRFWP